MPASMISAPTGGRPKVIGNSMAIVARGPMPGSTPIKVPTSAPIRQSPRLVGVTATPKPNQRFWNRSMMRPLEPRPELQRQVQPIREQERAECGEHHGADDGLDPAHFLGCVGRDHERDEARDHEAERTHRDAEYDRGGGDQ